MDLTPMRVSYNMSQRIRLQACHHTPYVSNDMVSIDCYEISPLTELVRNARVYISDLGDRLITVQLFETTTGA